MSNIKKLAGQTATYGLPSIIGRVLNYFLVPIHTDTFLPDKYGIISEFYAYVGFFVILLMMGMETTFFRFVNQAEDKVKTFNQAFSIVLIINVVFLVVVISSAQSIANWMQYPDMSNYVILFAIILATDALSSLFLVKLRFQQKAKEFALVQFASILTNILLNLFFIYVLLRPDDGIGIGYIFIANFFASLIKPVLLFKHVLQYRFIMEKAQAMKMLVYALPLMLAGFAGIINETFDRILIKRLLMSEGQEYAQAQVGIYSASYKLSILISLFIQAYRYAAEPFFFEQAKKEGGEKVYSKIMTYFVVIVSLMFLVISLNIPIFKWFMPNEAYWEGLKIVPILLLANVFLGIYYNQSIWYKLSDKTKYGAYLAGFGALLTLVFNFLLIPFIGYMGSAITTLIVYFSMMVGSYILGQKHYPIHYNLRKVGLYLLTSLGLYGISILLTGNELTFEWSNFMINCLLILLFIGLVLFMERPFKQFRKA